MEVARDISRGESVEGELDNFIRHRDQKRRETEGERRIRKLWQESASDAELSAALQTLQEHVRYRENLKQHALQGGRNSRPAWAEPGRRRRGGHTG